MGADTFTSACWAKTPQIAFSRLRDDAAWEHGHGGYTGTIAEKHAFSLFEKPASLHVSKVLELLYACDDDGVEWARECVEHARRYALSRPKGKITIANRQLREAEKRLKQAEREHARFVRKCGRHADLVERMWQVWTDKWGPAVCVEARSAKDKEQYGRWAGQRRAGERLWVFFGYASC